MTLPPGWPALIVAAGVSVISGTACAQQSAACIYQSESYSDGAYLCVRRSLMLRCTEDGGKLQWKIVAERDVSGLCSEPGEHADYRPSLPTRRETSGKCFYFKESRYCE